jgi:hypothetical protein
MSMQKALGWAVVAAIVASTGDARAASLADQITNVFGPSGVTLDIRPANPQFPPHTAHFSSDSLGTLGLLVTDLASSAADFPAVSTVPGFTYRLNPELEVFERQPGPLGPVFVERPGTLGKGKLDVGLSYLFVDFDDLNGEDIDGLEFAELGHNDCCASPPSPGVPGFENDTATLAFDEFQLQSHVISFFATYGLTDRWDVNVLVPIIQTSLDISATATVGNQSGAPVHFFDNDTQRTTETRSNDDEKFGVGDVQLRTKYRLLDGEPIGLAGGLAVRFETGDEENFQGIGATTLTPFVSTAKVFGPIDLHATGGIEINFEDSDRSRIRWGSGITWQLGERFALLADFIGSSNIRTDRLNVEVPTFETGPGTQPTKVVFRETSTDIIDFAPGVKALISENAVAFASVFIPVNEDGLRSDFVPAAGIEFSF